MEREKDFLINPNLLREMEKLYGKLKNKSEATTRLKVIKILSKANILVKNIENLIDGDFKARKLFNAYLVEQDYEINLSYLKEKQIKENLKEKLTFCFENNNLTRLNLMAARYWLLKKNKWEKVNSNLIGILKALQIIQNDVIFLQDLCKHKKDISYVEFPRNLKDYVFPDYKFDIKEYDFLYKNLIICLPSKIFSPEPGGLYHISQITDMYGNDIFSKVVCQNEILILKGDFTHKQLQKDIFVVVPTEEGFSYAEIIEWSRTEIIIKLPPNSTQGCIFIYDYGAEKEYIDCLEGNKPKILKDWAKYSLIDERFFYEEPNEQDFDIFFKPLKNSQFHSRFDPPECNNYPGYKPIIEYLKINGKEAFQGRMPVRELKPIYLWNGEEVEITFDGKFVEDVTMGDVLFKGWRLKIFSDDRMVLVDVGLSVNETSYRFTPQLEQSKLFTIELGATNRCLIIRNQHNLYYTPSNLDSIEVDNLWISDSNPYSINESLHTVERVEKISKMLVQMKPKLKILGIEATQGCQRFFVPNSTDSVINDNYRSLNNTVDLIKRRATILRVYVDSGIEETAEGADLLRVDGTVDYGKWFVQNAENGDSFYGRNKFNIDRDEQFHSLNFKINPYWVDAPVKTYSFRVYHPGREGQDGFEDSTSLTLEFKEGTGFTMRIVLYDDDHEGHERSINHDGRSDDEIRDDAVAVLEEYFPVPDFTIFDLPPLPKDRHKQTKRDLMRDDKKGWKRLGEDLENIAEGYPVDVPVWLGLTPVNNGYRLGGYGWARFLWVHPHAVAQAKKDNHIIPHEIAHTHDIWHTDCGIPQDERLDDHLNAIIPNGKTSHTGFKVYKMERIKANVGELMSYCGDIRWAAICTWEYLFEKIKEGA